MNVTSFPKNAWEIRKKGWRFFHPGFQKFIDRVKKSGCGVLLGGTEGIDEYNNTRRPTGSVPMGLPAGRGYIISRGQANMIQALAYWNENENPEDALGRWLKALKPATSTPTAIEQLESETTSDSD